MFTEKRMYFLSRYCSDYKNIEGFQAAYNDKSDTIYHCHHRKEIENGVVKYSSKQLKDLGMYYNVPPEDLIILTEREHYQLHCSAKGQKIYSTKEEADEAAKKSRYEYGKEYYEKNKDDINKRRRAHPEKRNQLRDTVCKWGSRHYWIEPKKAKFPKKWTEEQIEIYKDQYNKRK